MDPTVSSDYQPSAPPERRLAKRYQCPPVSVALVVFAPDDRPLRRRAGITKRVLARLRDVSMTGVRVELLAEPKVPPGGRLELVWSATATEVRIAHRYIDPESGLLVLGLEFKTTNDAFQRTVHEAVSEAREARRGRRGVRWPSQPARPTGGAATGRSW